MLVKNKTEIDHKVMPEGMTKQVCFLYHSTTFLIPMLNPAEGFVFLVGLEVHVLALCGV
jgi:hypothetical protein